MNSDRELLAAYLKQDCDTAFRELVERHIGLVHSTATRILYGDAHLAQDVAQSVFSDLARLAPTLSTNVVLGGWLHRRTCHVALALRRRNLRRALREQRAAAMSVHSPDPSPSPASLIPDLDEAVNQLNHADRTALLLRYYKELDLRSIGTALGTTEDAVQKRLHRALEKLQALLKRRGITTSTAALAALLATHATTAAPAGLALHVSSAALAASASASTGTSTLLLLKIMSYSKLQWAASALLLAGLSATLVHQHLQLRQLQTDNAQLEHQLATAPPSPSPATTPPIPNSSTLNTEMARLRTQAAELSHQTASLDRLRSTNRALRTATGEPDNPEEAQFRAETRERVMRVKQWALAFHMYSADHEGRLPDNFEQAASFQNSEGWLEIDTNRYEIVFRGTRQEAATLRDSILFRERESRRAPGGEWIRVYGFTDGSVRHQSFTNEADIATWEKDHLVPPATSQP